MSRYIAGTKDRMSDLDFYHPVGELYITLSDINPGTRWGGTWEQIKERFLLGTDSSQYKHLCNEGDSFTLNVKSYCRFGKDDKWIEKDLEAGTYTANADTFGGTDPYFGVLKEVQTYLTVYMWKRTA